MPAGLRSRKSRGAAKAARKPCRESVSGLRDKSERAGPRDGAMMLLAAIEKVAVQDDDGTLHIGRQALRDALYATADFDGVTGKLNCNEFGDCADPQIAVNQITGGEYVPLWEYIE